MDLFRCLSAGAAAKRKTTEFTAAREAAWYHVLALSWQWFETSRPIFTGTLCGQIRDSGLPSNCHQRSQIQANAGKRSRQTEGAIQLISLGRVRERFAALGTTSITNRLLYH